MALAQAVRESLVLLKNQNQLLPLPPKQRVLVAGDGANDMSRQAGGWTLSWQGDGTRREDFPNAETIWEGLEAQVRSGGGQAELAVDGRYRNRPDVAIVVFGEDPYAEFQGDLPNLMFKNGKSGDLELMRRLKADGIPVVGVFLSGRPLWLNRESTPPMPSWPHGCRDRKVGAWPMCCCVGPMGACNTTSAEAELLLATPRQPVPEQRGAEGLRPAVRLRIRPDLCRQGNLPALPRTRALIRTPPVAVPCSIVVWPAPA